MSYNMEKVGTGCECIFRFEKHYIDLALEAIIESKKKELKSMLERAENVKRSALAAAILANAPGMYNILIRDLETVQKRFAGMPTCEDS